MEANSELLMIKKKQKAEGKEEIEVKVSTSTTTVALRTLFTSYIPPERTSGLLSSSAKKSTLFDALAINKSPCCTGEITTVVKLFNEETQQIMNMKFKPAVRPSGQRPPENALTVPSKLVHNSLCYLYDLKKKNQEAPTPTGEQWYWSEDQWNRWIESNSFNLACDPFHLGQCWMYCNPPKSRGDGYVQTAIGFSHKDEGKKSNRPMLHNVSYLIKNPANAKLLAERWCLDPETNLPSSQEDLEPKLKKRKESDPLSLKDLKLEVSHLCHIPSCFNPWHLILEPHYINEDRKGCKYGCLHRCPHSPKCLFDTRF